jgi:hypothetical protein
MTAPQGVCRLMNRLSNQVGRRGAPTLHALYPRALQCYAQKHDQLSQRDIRAMRMGMCDPLAYVIHTLSIIEPTR